MAHLTPASIPCTSSPPPGRSLFSRLASPFSSRTRTLSDFYIIPEEPHKQYAPGDLVRGSVILTVLKSVRITHLVVCLRGFIQVYKSGGASGESSGESAGSGRHKISSESRGNGFTSLFEDEVVLCGEGRLEPGKYDFKFVLEFPGKRLPSSIDFERGSISYMITSTFTRPTTISPVLHCDIKVRLTQPIDIAPISTPPSRVITLEPISRRSRAKTSSKRDSSQQEKGKEIRSEGTPATSEARGSSSHRDSGEQPPRSPAPSEVSGESGVSSSTGSLTFRVGPVPSTAKASRRSNPTSSVTSLADQTITATVDLLRGGCLRGDTIPVRVSINHTKHIKSLHGIIITLYRQGRIDSHPILPLSSTKGKEAEKAKHEDYYPKTRTGLGGLSLSSAGSSSVYRKDLAQTFAPLILDPWTLSTVVTASVRVPEDAFPTIASVPGGMVSFRYYVEVVIDLGGKLGGQDRLLPRLGLVNLPANYGNAAGQSMHNGEEASTSMLAAWGGGVVETDTIRREKKVVDVQFEVVVGTKDTARGRAKRPETPKQSYEFQEAELHYVTDCSSPHALGGLQQQYGPAWHQDVDAQGYAMGQEESYGYHYPYYDPQIPVDVPPPDIRVSDETDEKARMKMAETRLLPSAPPEAEPGSPSAQTIRGPSAPVVSHNEQYLPYNESQRNDVCTSGGPLLPPHLQMDYNRLSTSPMEVGESSSHGSTLQNGVHVAARDSSPAYAGEGASPTDDKLDRERRRLQAEASAPEDYVEDDEAGQRVGMTAVPLSIAATAPSAPTLTEAEEYGYHGPEHISDTLPRYER